MSTRPSHDLPDGGTTRTRLDAWKTLLGAAGAGDVRSLLDSIADTAAATGVQAGDVERWRRSHDPDIVSAAIELVEARRRAERKFPARAATLVADQPGVEQATSAAVGAWKAARFPPGARVLDLCCGIGGDAIALVARGCDVSAVDRDPLRSWMAACNAGCPSDVDDAIAFAARALDARGDLFLHVDPARRDEVARSRRFDPEAFMPPWSLVVPLLDRASGACVKLGPGAPWPMPGLDADAAEFEVVAERGRLVQGLVWTGALATDPGCVRATRIEPDDVHSIVGFAEDPIPLEHDASKDDGWIDERPWIIERHEAAERVRLCDEAVGEEIDARELAPGLGLLVAAERPTSTWCRAWRVRSVVGARPERVRRELRALDVSSVVVKVRGGAGNADQWTRELSRDLARRRARADADAPNGDLRERREVVVFVVRFGRRAVAVLAEAATDRSTAPGSSIVEE